MKTYEELMIENEQLKNKLLMADKLNKEAFEQLIEANKIVREYENAMKVERYKAWK